MPSKSFPSPLTDADYEAIEAAVMETFRGRWFLAEYARRNRAADTRTLLAAIERLEAVIRSGPNGDPWPDDGPKPVPQPAQPAAPRAAAGVPDQPAAPAGQSPQNPTASEPRTRPAAPEAGRTSLGPLAQAMVAQADPLAPVRALSDEEKIALFS